MFNSKFNQLFKLIMEQYSSSPLDYPIEFNYSDIINKIEQCINLNDSEKLTQFENIFNMIPKNLQENFYFDFKNRVLNKNISAYNKISGMSNSINELQKNFEAQKLFSLIKHELNWLNFYIKQTKNPTEILVLNQYPTGDLEIGEYRRQY